MNNSASLGLIGTETSISRSLTTLTMIDQFLPEGRQTVSLTIDEDRDVFGIQFLLDINMNMVSNIELASDDLNVTQDNYSLFQNKISISIHNASAQNIESDILNIIIDVKKAGFLSDMISLSSKGMDNEIYTEADGTVVSSRIDIDMINRSTELPHSFELLQNVPNPFTTTTEIGFVLPSDQQVSLKIMDVTGKVVIHKSGHYQKGLNSIMINVNDINTSGILYYQIDTEYNSASSKMIIIK